MPGRARNNGLPEFLTSATLGDILAAELETAADPQPDQDGYLSPVELARRSMLRRAAAEIRAHHTPADGQP